MYIYMSYMSYISYIFTIHKWSMIVSFLQHLLILLLKYHILIVHWRTLSFITSMDNIHFDLYWRFNESISKWFKCDVFEMKQTIESTKKRKREMRVNHFLVWLVYCFPPRIPSSHFFPFYIQLISKWVTILMNEFKLN